MATQQVTSITPAAREAWWLEQHELWATLEEIRAEIAARTQGALDDDTRAIQG